MRVLLLILLTAFFFSGCASSPYGSFVEKNAQVEDAIVSDAISKLTALYLPAKTEFFLIQEVDKKDRFGLELLNSIRAKGYAVQEYTKDVTPTGLTLAYTLDKIDDYIRLTIYVGNEAISRAYVNNAGNVEPSGTWSRKE